MQPRSDEELLAAHRAGDPTAFRELASRYVDELYAFLSRFVGNPTLAEDLVQETFLQVHLSAESFDPSRAFKPWLYAIATNKARDALRARTRRREQSLDVGASADERPAPVQSLESAEHGPTEHSEARERRETVQALLSRMPEHLRLILILGYYQQLPYAQIAEILGIPVGTVKSRLHAAVQYFGKLWREQAAENAPLKAS